MMKPQPGGASRIFRSLAICAATIAISVADTPRFIPATPENTRLADGLPLPEKLESIGWRWQPEKGNGGVFESIPSPGGKPAMMMIQAGGLDSGAMYEVFGYFWADGFDRVEPDTREQRPTQFGVTLARLQTFDGKTPPGEGVVQTWMVTPGSEVGKAFGYSVALEEEQPLPGTKKLKWNEGGKARLVRARLGYSKAGKDGSLPVFFADYSYDRPSGPAWIDGIALRPVDANVPSEEGWKPGTRLHLAIRTADKITTQRELDAGADVNAFDEEGITPLFYATAAGDMPLMESLLSRGANPNQPGQSVPPLSAAAIRSDVEMVRRLLDAGAEIPLGTAKDSGLLATPIHPAYLHPLIVAIRARALSVVKLLYERQPALDLEKILSLDIMRYQKKGDPAPPDPKLVAMALAREDWEMAAFLINRGAGMNASGNPAASNNWLMARAAAGGDDALPVVDSLIKRGINPVQGERAGIPPAEQKHSVPIEYPFSVEYKKDGLKSAVWFDQVNMVRKFLPYAENTPAQYQDELLMLAMYRGNQEVIDLVRGRFPLAAPARWNPTLAKSEKEAEISEEERRIFLPRTTTPPAREGEKSAGHVIGVISSPEGAGPADMFSAVASGIEGWKVVDREATDLALRELSIGKPWQDGRFNMAALGDQLAADVILIVNQVKTSATRINSYEVVEVSTGLVVHREHLDEKDFDAQKEIPGMLERINRAIGASASGQKRQAVTLLTFSVSKDVADSAVLAKLLKARIQYEVDSNPGLISLTRQQTSRLVEEQAIKGENSIWGASHLVEGSIASADDGKISVKLRLETLGANGTRKTDAHAEGLPANVTELIADAWNQLLSPEGGVLELGRRAASKFDQKIASQEAERLAREAEWLYAINASTDKIESTIQSAMALGLPEDRAVTMHLGVLYFKISSLKSKLKHSHVNDHQNGIGSQASLDEIPLYLDTADKLAWELPKAIDLLGHSRHYMEKHRNGFLSGNGISEKVQKEVSEAISALMSVRAMLYDKFIPAECLADFNSFSNDLEILTKDFFEILDSKRNSGSDGIVLMGGGFSTEIIRKNPSVIESLVRRIKTEKRERWLNQLAEFLSHGDHTWDYEFHKIARDRSISDLEKNQSDFSRKRIAWLKTKLTNGEEEKEKINEFISTVHNQSSDRMLVGNDYKLYATIVERHTPSIWFAGGEDRKFWGKGTRALPSVYHNRMNTPDLMTRFQDYIALFRNEGRIDGPFEQRNKEFLAKLGYYQKTTASAEDEIRSASEKGASTIGYSLSEILLGYVYANRPHGQPSSGAPNASSAVGKSSESLTTATLIADLTAEGIIGSGCFIWPILDCSSPDILWISYFQSLDSRLPSRELLDGWLFKKTWLVAIDSKTGEVMKKFDLHSSVDGVSGRGSSRSPARVWDMALGQTREKIMTTIEWQKEGRLSKSATAVIDKASGKVFVLPEHETISNHKNSNVISKSLIVGSGNGFYFISNREVRHIDQNNSITRLTERSRKPEMTPFDSIDRDPVSILNFEDQLLVGGKNHAALYDPTNRSWKAIENPAKELGRNYTYLGTDRPSANPAFQMPDLNLVIEGVASKWRIEISKPQRMSLCFKHEDGSVRIIPVSLSLPDDFLAKVKVVGQGEIDESDPSRSRKKTDISFSDYLNDDELFLCVLNQTMDDLVVGLEIGNLPYWTGPSKHKFHLPFLWKIPKKDLLENLNN